MTLPQPTRHDAVVDRPRPALRHLRGRFRQALFSPSGRLEGLLLEIGQRTVQVVLDIAQAPPALSRVEPGRFLSIEATEMRGEGAGRAHPLYAFRSLIAVDGRPAQTAPAVLRGRVSAINYARNGLADGVLLDSGEFVHLGTDGFRVAELAIGHPVIATGYPQRLAGGGCFLAATRINGIPLAHANEAATLTEREPARLPRRETHWAEFHL